jgi:hypothetical protein
MASPWRLWLDACPAVSVYRRPLKVRKVAYRFAQTVPRGMAMRRLCLVVAVLCAAACLGSCGCSQADDVLRDGRGVLVWQTGEEARAGYR